MSHRSLCIAYLRSSRKLRKHDEEGICKTIYSWHEGNSSGELALWMPAEILSPKRKDC